MNFVEAISSCFRNYANFSGRAVRSEYWYWFLFVAIVLIVFGAIDESLYPGPLNIGLFSYVTMAVVLALILPTLAVSVRRLHVGSGRRSGRTGPRREPGGGLIVAPDARFRAATPSGLAE
jgi:hypothetical protein